MRRRRNWHHFLAGQAEISPFSLVLSQLLDADPPVVIGFSAHDPAAFPFLHSFPA